MNDLDKEIETVKKDRLLKRVYSTESTCSQNGISDKYSQHQIDPLLLLSSPKKNQVIIKEKVSGKQAEQLIQPVFEKIDAELNKLEEAARHKSQMNKANHKSNPNLLNINQYDGFQRTRTHSQHMDPLGSIIYQQHQENNYKLPQKTPNFAQFQSQMYSSHSNLIDNANNFTKKPFETFVPNQMQYSNDHYYSSNDFYKSEFEVPKKEPKKQAKTTLITKLQNLILPNSSQNKS